MKMIEYNSIDDYIMDLSISLADEVKRSDDLSKTELVYIIERALRDFAAHYKMDLKFRELLESETNQEISKGR